MAISGRKADDDGAVRGGSGDGLVLKPGYLDREGQVELLGLLRAALVEAPLFTPTMPRTGKPFSVRMTNLGPLGWVSDAQGGYRYQAAHPETGRSWPAIPDMLLKAWDEIGGYSHPPEACLVNWYAPGTRMGLHQDRDEDDFDAPVVSLSLGDAALFRLGGLKRSDPTRSFRFASGDAMALSGETRLAFHGVDKIYPGTSSLLKDGGRINLTLRRVTRPRR